MNKMKLNIQLFGTWAGSNTATSTSGWAKMSDNSFCDIGYNTVTRNGSTVTINFGIRLKYNSTTFSYALIGYNSYTITGTYASGSGGGTGNGSGYFAKNNKNISGKNTVYYAYCLPSNTACLASSLTPCTTETFKFTATATVNCAAAGTLTLKGLGRRGHSSSAQGQPSISVPYPAATYTMTVRKTTGIADITSPAWGWTGDYKTGTVTYGQSFNVNVSIATGYHWVNWTGSFTTTTQNYTFTVGAQNYDITANAALNYWTLTASKGTGISATSGGGSKGYNTSCTVTATVSSGYTFDGWYNGSTRVSTSTSYTFNMPNNNLTLTAKANVNTYTNRIDHWTWGYLYGEGNNGDKTAFQLGSTTFNQTYNSSYVMDESRKMTIPNGFYLVSTFGTSSISGSWATYNMGTSVTQKAAGMSYEYDYRPNTYNITYVMNGGTNPSTNPTTYNVLYGVTFADPSRSGYNFVNWTIGGSVVTGINPGANASFTSPTDLYNKCGARTIGDKTVVANWIEIAPSNVQINGTVVSATQIDLNWSATGENISKYILYYKLSTSSSYSSIDCGTNTSYNFIAEEGKTYNFYVSATNPGGTANSNTITITTPISSGANLYIKINGVWKKGPVWIKTNNNWVKATDIYIKQNGSWIKQIN